MIIHLFLSINLYILRFFRYYFSNIIDCGFLANVEVNSENILTVVVLTKRTKMTCVVIK